MIPQFFHWMSLVEKLENEIKIKLRTHIGAEKVNKSRFGNQ